MSLPDNTKIQSFSLRVKNLEEMCFFYEHMLGLKISSQNKNEVSLSVNGNENPLLILKEDKDVKFNSRYYPGLYHIALKFPDRESLGKEFLHLFNKGQKFHGFSDHIVSEAIYLADPEENGIELYVDKPVSIWTWKMGEVEMATQPLNLNVLTDEIKNRDEDFKGMDTNAGIGHIHLQVSSLDKAEKFYHDILGMDITNSSYNGALFFSAGGYHHHVGANIWHSRNSPPLPEDSAGLISFTVNIPDEKAIEEIMEHAENEGLLVDRETHLVKDFDNNKILLSL